MRNHLLIEFVLPGSILKPQTVISVEKVSTRHARVREPRYVSAYPVVVFSIQGIRQLARRRDAEFAYGEVWFQGRDGWRRGSKYPLP